MRIVRCGVLLSLLGCSAPAGSAAPTTILPPERTAAASSRSGDAEPPPDATAPPAALRVVFERSGQYCGGTPPPPEVMAAARAPHPLKDLLVGVKRGKESRGEVIAEAKTDAKGSVAFDVPPGTYCVVRESRYKPAPPPAERQYVRVDAQCMAKYRSECDAVVEVGAPKREPIVVSESLGCFVGGPCESYQGPMPP